MRIITIGSALIDIFIRSEHFLKDSHGIIRVGEVGGKFDVDSFILKTGGGASNTAVGFSRLGFDSAIISETGHDELAKTVIEDLRKEKVDISLMIHEKKEETGGSVILVLADGSRAVLVHRGASSQLDPKDIDIKEISQADWIHISSLSGRLDTLKHIFSVLRFCLLFLSRSSLTSAKSLALSFLEIFRKSFSIFSMNYFLSIFFNIFTKSTAFNPFPLLSLIASKTVYSL